MMRKSAFVALIGCLGCQEYVTLGVAPSMLGSDVRVSVDPNASAVSFSAIGSHVKRAEGKVLRQTDSTLTIGVTEVTRLNGLEDAWQGDTVDFARSNIVGVEQRRVSTPRTLLSLGSLVAGGILAHSGLQGSRNVIVGQPPPGGGN
jgi:hypothetical protein